MKNVPTKLSNCIKRSVHQWHEAKENNNPLNEFLVMTEEEYAQFEAHDIVPDSINALYEGYNVPENLPAIPPLILTKLQYLREFEQCRSPRCLLRIICDLGPRSIYLTPIRRWIEEDQLRIASIAWYYKETRGE